MTSQSRQSSVTVVMPRLVFHSALLVISLLVAPGVDEPLRIRRFDGDATRAVLRRSSCWSLRQELLVTRLVPSEPCPLAAAAAATATAAAAACGHVASASTNSASRGSLWTGLQPLLVAFAAQTGEKQELRQYRNASPYEEEAIHKLAKGINSQLKHEHRTHDVNDNDQAGDGVELRDRDYGKQSAGIVNEIPHRPTDMKLLSIDDDNDDDDVTSSSGMLTSDVTLMQITAAGMNAATSAAGSSRKDDLVASLSQLVYAAACRALIEHNDWTNSSSSRSSHRLGHGTVGSGGGDEELASRSEQHDADAVAAALADSDLCNEGGAVQGNQMVENPAHVALVAGALMRLIRVEEQEGQHLVASKHHDGSGSRDDEMMNDADEDDAAKDHDDDGTPLEHVLAAVAPHNGEMKQKGKISRVLLLSSTEQSNETDKEAAGAVNEDFEKVAASVSVETKLATPTSRIASHLALMSIFADMGEKRLVEAKEHVQQLIAEMEMASTRAGEPGRKKEQESEEMDGSEDAAKLHGRRHSMNEIRRQENLKLGALRSCKTQIDLGITFVRQAKVGLTHPHHWKGDGDRVFEMAHELSLEPTRSVEQIMATLKGSQSECSKDCVGGKPALKMKLLLKSVREAIDRMGDALILASDCEATIVEHAPDLQSHSTFELVQARFQSAHSSMKPSIAVLKSLHDGHQRLARNHRKLLRGRGGEKGDTTASAPGALHLDSFRDGSDGRMREQQLVLREVGAMQRRVLREMGWEEEREEVRGFVGEEEVDVEDEDVQWLQQYGEMMNFVGNQTRWSVGVNIEERGKLKRELKLRVQVRQQPRKKAHKPKVRRKLKLRVQVRQQGKKARKPKVRRKLKLRVQVRQKKRWVSKAKITSMGKKTAAAKRQRKVRLRGLKPNAMVDQKGLKGFRTIQAALDANPYGGFSTRRYVIFIGPGVFNEKIEITWPRVVLVGAGPGRTIITAAASTAKGFATYYTSTVGMIGESLVAFGITFVNSAPAGEGQAVAFRTSVNRAAFYGCQFLGYQDTLYPQLGRQYFEKCGVTGSVDFVMGRSSMVMSNSVIGVKWHASGSSVVAAQGRNTSDDNSGFVFLRTRIVNLDKTRKQFAYLARPWRPFSRVVYINCFMSDAINSAGWGDWAGLTFSGKPYFAEFGSYGPGSRGPRASWAFPRKLPLRLVSFFRPNQFILGQTWVPYSQVPYSP